jgi:hypothetical protein
MDVKVQKRSRPEMKVRRVLPHIHKAPDRPQSGNQVVMAHPLPVALFPLHSRGQRGSGHTFSHRDALGVRGVQARRPGGISSLVFSLRMPRHGIDDGPALACISTEFVPGARRQPPHLSGTPTITADRGRGHRRLHAVTGTVPRIVGCLRRRITGTQNDAPERAAPTSERAPNRRSVCRRSRARMCRYGAPRRTQGSTVRWARSVRIRVARTLCHRRVGRGSCHRASAVRRGFNQQCGSRFPPRPHTL